MTVVIRCNAEWQGREGVVRQVQRRQVRQGPEVDWKGRQLVVRQVDRRQCGEVGKGIGKRLQLVVVELLIGLRVSRHHCLIETDIHRRS